MQGSLIKHIVIQYALWGIMVPLQICNMLKKKHEEAKEILVRAVVNNNNLLMLNHPIYEAKISFKIFLAFTIIFFHLPFWYKIKLHIPSQLRTFMKFRNLLQKWHPRSFKHVEEWGHIKAFSFAMVFGFVIFLHTETAYQNFGYNDTN